MLPNVDVYKKQSLDFQYQIKKEICKECASCYYWGIESPENIAVYLTHRWRCFCEAMPMQNNYWFDGKDWYCSLWEQREK